jgi:ribosomal protein S18 acetylase RimI-like enzyme
VQVRSLGYRTDLMIRALEGSQIADHGDSLVIRSPRHPEFWWGNFLMLPAQPGPGEASLWLSRFAAEFPQARHIALGIDATDDQPMEIGGLLAAGLRRDRVTVMTASAVHDPPRPQHDAAYRQLLGDDDWRQAAGLRALCNSTALGADRAFTDARIRAQRALTEAGRGSWFGAFRDGQLLAQLGLVTAGDGIARYQDVETHPAVRRQGLAGTLVCQAGRHVISALGAHTLVIVADPDAGAIRVYRSAGFTDAEIQLGFERPPAAAKG